MQIAPSVNPRWWWPFAGAVALVALDQLTKYVATTELASGPVEILPFLTFRYLCNTGAAFSILQGFTGFLTFVGVAFVVFFSWEIWRLRSIEQPPLLFVLALALILAGAAGNLIDRVRQGCVVDFVHFEHGEWLNFPIFNLADSAVCIGAACWILAALLNREQSKKVVADDGD